MDFEKCKEIKVDTESLDRLLTQYQTLILDKMEQIINNQYTEFLSRLKCWRDLDGWAVSGMNRPGDWFDHNPDLELNTYTRELDPLIRLSHQVWLLQTNLQMLDSHTSNGAEGKQFNEYQIEFLDTLMNTAVKLPS